jgi:hypothetical protein
MSKPKRPTTRLIEIPEVSELVTPVEVVLSKPPKT